MTFEVIFGLGSSTASWPWFNILECACLKALPEWPSLQFVILLMFLLAFTRSRKTALVVISTKKKS